MVYCSYTTYGQSRLGVRAGIHLNYRRQRSDILPGPAEAIPSSSGQPDLHPVHLERLGERDYFQSRTVQG